MGRSTSSGRELAARLDALPRDLTNRFRTVLAAGPLDDWGYTELARAVEDEALLTADERAELQDLLDARHREHEHRA